MNHEYKIIPVNAIKPDDNNPRTHLPSQIEQIQNSIKEFGFTNPLLVDESMNLIAGHGRLLAAKASEMSNVPVIIVRGLNAKQKRMLLIADNQLALNAQWDIQILLAELGKFSVEDVAIVGFDDAQIAAMMAQIQQIGEVNAADAWGGMPEFNQGDVSAFRSLLIHFKDQEAVDAFTKLIGQEITDKTKFVWYPEAERVTTKDKLYTSDESIDE